MTTGRIALPQKRVQRATAGQRLMAHATPDNSREQRVVATRFQIRFPHHPDLPNALAMLGLTETKGVTRG